MAYVYLPSDHSGSVVGGRTGCRYRSRLCVSCKALPWSGCAGMLLISAYLIYMQLYLCELWCPVDSNEQIKFTFFRAYFCNVDMEVANRVFFEFFLYRLIAFGIWQSVDAMSWKAAVQSWPGQVGNRGLKRVQAIIQRQQLCLRNATQMASSSFIKTLDTGSLGTHRRIMDKVPFAPLRYRLLVDSVAHGQNLQALLTMLYRSTQRLSRTGASVQYLSHNYSLRRWLYITPPHHGTKQRVKLWIASFSDFYTLTVLVKITFWAKSVTWLGIDRKRQSIRCNLMHKYAYAKFLPKSSFLYQLIQAPANNGYPAMAVYQK